MFKNIRVTGYTLKTIVNAASTFEDGDQVGFRKTIEGIYNLKNTQNFRDAVVAAAPGASAKEVSNMQLAMLVDRIIEGFPYISPFEKEVAILSSHHLAHFVLMQSDNEVVLQSCMQSLFKLNHETFVKPNDDIVSGLFGADE